MDSSVHNPDRFMVDLRQLLSQGRKRIGIFVGAGAPTALKVNAEGELSESGSALIPDVLRLTQLVLELLNEDDKQVIDKLIEDLPPSPNIELILTKVRKLSLALGNHSVLGLNGDGYSQLANRICECIGNYVKRTLPKSPNPYTELVSWIGGTQKEFSVEIFTPNYDLLLEEAFERAKRPYFDGFSGSCNPFFDPVSIETESVPANWSKIWKIHGSLGWEVSADSIIRTGKREASSLIYPDHLKYDHIARQPFSSLFERLKKFLNTPDTILICTGFSFFDHHIASVIDESIAKNKHTAVLAFQYKDLVDEPYAVKLAMDRPNMSVYAKDGAVICGVKGMWKPGDLPSKEWDSIRRSFWHSQDKYFTLGDFAKLTRFFSLANAEQLLIQSGNGTVDEDNIDAKP